MWEPTNQIFSTLWQIVTILLNVTSESWRIDDKFNSFTFFRVYLKSWRSVFLSKSRPDKNILLQFVRSMLVRLIQLERISTKVLSVMLQDLNESDLRLSLSCLHDLSRTCLVFMELSSWLSVRWDKRRWLMDDKGTYCVSPLKCSITSFCRMGSREASYQVLHTRAASLRSDTFRKRSMCVTTWNLDTKNECTCDVIILTIFHNKIWCQNKLMIC